MKFLNDPIYDFPFKFIKTRIMNINVNIIRINTMKK